MNYENPELLKSELKKGNENALAFLIDKYHKPLCLYAYNLLNDYDNSKDIVQNIYLRLWEKRGEVKNINSIKSFLYKSVYNEFLNHYRDNRKFLLFEQEHFTAFDDLIIEEDDGLIKKQMKMVFEEIQKLPPKCKNIFLLSKKEGLTNEEIAEHLKISIKTVENHITKAFKILKENLNEKQKDLNDEKISSGYQRTSFSDKARFMFFLLFGYKNQLSRLAIR